MASCCLLKKRLLIISQRVLDNNSDLITVHVQHVNPELQGEGIQPRMEMRLHRFLSDVGFCSKRQGEKLIRAGKIVVDGRKAIMGDTVSGNEDIFIDGQKLQVKKSPKKKALAFYKPQGVECSLSPNPNGTTLLDFNFGPDRVFPIGRLDKDSHGLLLLTNDGTLANRLAQPSLEHDEEYILVVEGQITSETISQLAQGVVLANKKTAPCRIEHMEKNVFRIILHDGHNRQIRKMCEKVGLQLRDIKRVRIGSVLLQNLKEGEWRVLGDQEFHMLKN
jgi:pseudouridine synthase